MCSIEYSQRKLRIKNQSNVCIRIEIMTHMCCNSTTTACIEIPKGESVYLCFIENVDSDASQNVKLSYCNPLEGWNEFASVPLESISQDLIGVIDNQGIPVVTH